MEKDLNIEFRYGADNWPVIEDGWSPPEHNLQWMIGIESKLLLPRPPIAARYRLFLTVQPHVRAGVLPRQVLITAVNDVIIGVEELSKQDTIEYEVPRYALELADTVTLRFIHPNAASPRQIADIPDDRLLAVAAERLRLRSYVLTDLEDQKQPPASTVPEPGKTSSAAGSAELRLAPKPAAIRAETASSRL